MRCAVACCAVLSLVYTANTGSAPPTASSMRSASRSAPSSSSARARSAGGASAASRSFSTPPTPPWAPCPQARPGANARSLAVPGAGSTTARRSSLCARRPQHARRCLLARVRNIYAFVAPFYRYQKQIILPRQARDKPRKGWGARRFCAGGSPGDAKNPCKCSGDGIGDLATMEIVDKLHIPADLPAGEWVLGWRWVRKTKTKTRTSFRCDFRCIFHARENRPFAKTGSGQTVRDRQKGNPMLCAGLRGEYPSVAELLGKSRALSASLSLSLPLYLVAAPPEVY
jgi:hypothetical protein